MSYGMMVAVQMGKKAEFDALWNWSKTYMYHAEADHPARGFFSWSMKTDGTPNDETPAPDGEEYYATALYFASGRWGNGTGIYNYRQEADRLLSDMLHREVLRGEVVRGRTARGPYACGNMFDEKFKMVRFVPGALGQWHRDLQLPPGGRPPAERHAASRGLAWRSCARPDRARPIRMRQHVRREV